MTRHETILGGLLFLLLCAEGWLFVQLNRETALRADAEIRLLQCSQAPAPRRSGTTALAP